MSLKVIRRKDSGTLQIVGRVAGQFIRRGAQSRTLALAQEEAAALEARILREAFHGKRRGDKPFFEIAGAYLKAEPRHPVNAKRIGKIVEALGPNVIAYQVDQETVDALRDRLLRPRPSPATARAEIITPIRAILNFGFRRGWCERPSFELPRIKQGQTRFFTPSQAERLIAAAAPHLQPLLVFLFGVGSRLAETLALDWERDIDLVGARVIFQPETTKTHARRVAHLPPAVVAALASLPHREGAVFRWETNPSKDGQARRRNAYAGREGGGHIRTAWRSAIRRAGLDPKLTPHATRHSFASWHYAIHRDLLLLMREGGWETIAMVQRYAHLMPRGQEVDIARMWGQEKAA